MPKKLIPQKGVKDLEILAYIKVTITLSVWTKKIISVVKMIEKIYRWKCRENEYMHSWYERNDG